MEDRSPRSARKGPGCCGWIVIAVMAWVLFNWLLSLGSSESPDTGSATTSNAPVVNSVVVTRAEYGDAWPLTVDSGILRYDAGVILEAGGVTYAVNGTAMTNYPNMQRINAIWADDTRHPGLGMKKDIGPLIDRGLALRR